MAAYSPTPSELAQLVALLAQRYGEARSKEISRFRIARRTLRRLSGRPQLRDLLISKWIKLMAAEQGWLVFAGTDEFLMVRAEVGQHWTKVGTKRLDDLLARLAEGDRGAITDAAAELKPFVPAAAEGEEEKPEA